MKKVGILTLFYNNRNYGGLLQAYALSRFIGEMGYICEQICFKNRGAAHKKRHFKIKNIPIYVRTLFRLYVAKYRMDKALNEKRNIAMTEFRNKIPHSQIIYNSDNIRESIGRYDAFVTGSDQVWNLDWYRKEYFLNFVPENVCKFSYAASMPNIKITAEQKETVKKHLESFDAVSVREGETAEFLKTLTGKDVRQTLDPTLLLEKSQWDDICSDRVVDGEYVFCYFLGNEREKRKQALRFAKNVKCKLVTLPHLVTYCTSDCFFADINLYDISPEQFISLIKYAKYVITDSFHAAVFSTIYSTKYFVFDRTDAGKMSRRITTLLSLTGNDFRFCCGSKGSANYMLEIKDKPVSCTSVEFEKMKTDSIEFLKNVLEKL